MDRVQLKNKTRPISAASFPDYDPYQELVSFGVNGNTQLGKALYENGKKFYDQETIPKNDSKVKSDKRYLSSNNTKDIDLTSNYRQNDLMEEFVKELEAYQSNSDLSHSMGQRESESTSSSCSLEVQANSDLGTTRM